MVNKIENTRLIRDGLEVTRVGLGCMGFAHAYRAPTDKAEEVAIIRKVYDMEKHQSVSSAANAKRYIRSI